MSLPVEWREPLDLFRRPDEALYWPYLAATLVVAAAVTWTRRRGGERAIAVGFDRRSSRHDAAIFLINAVLFTTLTSAVLVGGPFAYWFRARVTAVIGEPALLHGWPARAVLTVASFLAIDFAIFFTHYLQHRLPVLWCFHKVHHSATVLTPLTAYRNHPFDDIVEGIGATVIVGVVDGVVLALIAPHVTSLQVAGTNALFIVALAGLANLRHTQTWLPLGRFDHLISSPAQHQIHHSVDPAHYDRNFGGILSIWDRLFGTLVVPPRRATITFGLAGADGSRTLAEHYFTPVAEAARWTARRLRPVAPVARERTSV